MQRRTFLRGTLAASATGIAIGAGLLTPATVLAAWPKDAFEAKDVASAIQAFGGGAATESADVSIKAPDIAENGAVVPITVSTSMTGVESIAIVAAKNPSPLVASFNMGEGAEAFVSTRIKMGQSGDVVAVVKSGGKLYSAKKEVKVTIGGCGG